VIYTASLSKYADPLIDILDNKNKKVIDYRLFREHCTFFQGVFIKDMSLLGRPLSDVIIIDNSPSSYAFH
jgi:RNA polymerase II subunit A small phosphatase-like protein